MNITVTPDDGYKAVGVVGFYSSEWPIYFTRCVLSSATNVNALVNNTYASTITTNIGVDVLEVKEL